MSVQYNFHLKATLRAADVAQMVFEASGCSVVSARRESLFTAGYAGEVVTISIIAEADHAVWQRLEAIVSGFGILVLTTDQPCTIL